MSNLFSALSLFLPFTYLSGCFPLSFQYSFCPVPCLACPQPRQLSSYLVAPSHSANVTFWRKLLKIIITYVKYFHFIFASSTNFFHSTHDKFETLHLFFFFSHLCLLLALRYFKKYMCVYSTPRYHGIIGLVGNPGLKKEKNLPS